MLSGERAAHPDLVLGYFAQHTVESLHEGQTPIDHLRDIAPNVATQDFRDFLGRWNFAGRARVRGRRRILRRRARAARARIDRLAQAERAAARRTDQPPRPRHARSAGRGAQRFSPARSCWSRTTAISPALSAIRSGASPTARSKSSTAISTSTRHGCARAGRMPARRSRAGSRTSRSPRLRRSRRKPTGNAKRVRALSCLRD